MGSEKTSETLCQKNLARKMATRRKRQIVLPALGRAAVAVGVDLQNQRHWRRDGRLGAEGGALCRRSLLFAILPGDRRNTVK